MKISFYGSAGIVTGSNYLLEIGEKKILLMRDVQEDDRLTDSIFNPFLITGRVISVLTPHIDLRTYSQFSKAGLRKYTVLKQLDLCYPVMFHIQEMEQNGIIGKSTCRLSLHLYT